MARRRQARHCTAHRTNGEPCKGWAIQGGTVCAAHGGRASQVRAAASERLAADAAARFGIRVATTASEALQDALECENGIVQYLWEKIGTDNPADLIGESRTRAMYALYEQAQLRRTKIAADMARLKIEERRQHVLERDIDVIAAAWGRLLAAFARAWNLSAQQLAEGRQIVAEQLEALGGGT